MERLIYVLDSNVITDRINAREPVSRQLTVAVESAHQVCLCQPVYYEILRGLLKTNATRKLHLFQTMIVPLLTWIPLTDADWIQAAQFWANTVSAGKQLADMDLLVGAIVTADDDFEALPIKRENWRIV